MTQVDFYDKEQVDDLLEGKADATSVGAETDQESETGSLWSRVKYVLGHWMTKDTEQTVTGKKIFSGGAEVPTSPATAASAVNSVYVNDATEGVNNLVHKSGNETKTGTLTCYKIVGNAFEYCGTRYNNDETKFYRIIKIDSGNWFKIALEGLSGDEYFTSQFAVFNNNLRFSKKESTWGNRRIIVAIETDGTIDILTNSHGTGGTFGPTIMYKMFYPNSSVLLPKSLYTVYVDPPAIDLPTVGTDYIKVMEVGL